MAPESPDEQQPSRTEHLVALFPDLSVQIRGALTRRGAPSWILDDVVAEAFARALANPGACPEAALRPWLHVVARNIYVDWWREHSRYTDSQSIPDETVEDVAETVERLFDFQTVCRAVSGLPDTQREALRELLDEDGRGDTGDRAAVVRRAAARYRARATLARLLDADRPQPPPG